MASSRRLHVENRDSDHIESSGTRTAWSVTPVINTARVGRVATHRPVWPWTRPGGSPAWQSWPPLRMQRVAAPTTVTAIPPARGAFSVALPGDAASLTAASRRVVQSRRDESVWYRSHALLSIPTYTWRHGETVSDVGRINEVNQRQARLLLGWVTYSGG